MSEELTKLAKLANKAAGDFKPTPHNMSPQNFGKFHGVQAMGPVKEDKSIRVKSELVSSYNNKLDSIKEEGLNLNSASFNNLNSTTGPGTGMGTNIDIKKEESGGKKDGMKKEENGGGGGGVFHEKQLLQGSNTDQLDVKNLPVSQHDKLQTSPNWNNKQTDGHMVMNRENNRIDGPQFPHMPMQYPQHYHGPNQAHQPSHVFSTLLANQAAKAVYTGQANSIITFHQTLTANRKFLDPEQDIKVDRANNQPPASTPTPPQADRGDSNTTAGNPTPGNPAAAQKTDAAENLKHTSNGAENAATPSNNSNGPKEDTNGPEPTAKPSSNPRTPQGSNPGIVDPPPSRPQAASESAPPPSKPTRTGTAKKGKRKRPQPSSQPLHPNMPPVGANMAMQQGMPPSGPSFAPFPRGPFGPGSGPYPPQNPQMPIRPGMPTQAGVGGPTTTETENLDPSALWENPPANKRQMMSTMAPSWSQQEFAMGNPSLGGNMGPQGPGMMPPRPDGMMAQRTFMSPNGQNPHDQFPVHMAGPPYDLANFNTGQPVDNLTPEQMRHREERLRTLKEMQKILFPEEHQNTSPSPGGMLSPHGAMPPQEMGPGMVSPSGGMMMGPMGPGSMMGPGGPHPMMGGGMPHPRMPHPPPEAMRGMSPAEQQRFMMSQPSQAPPLPQDFDSMTPEQKAWVKLQQDFYVEKQRKMMEEQAKMQHSHMMDFPGRGPTMRFGPGPGHGPFPPGEAMGQTMPPPPPYHASAASILQRRASMSGSYSPGGGGPPGSFGPMSPHGMSTAQPPQRLARSNSLPSAQMGPMGPGGSMPMQGSLSPESSPIRTPYRASTPTPASLTASSNPSMTSGMNPGSAGMSGGPMSAPAMTSSINSPGMSMAQSCENAPLSNTMVHTPGSMVVHSPHPNQPGTPVVDPSMQGGTPGNMRQGTPNPGTPTPAVSAVKQAMATSGNQRCSPKPTLEQNSINKSSENPSSNGGDSRKTAGGGGGGGDTILPQQQQQKLVNFPPSQLNRDKAPNFPPRGEDLQQYTSTFYQKTMSKEQQPQGPNRMQQQFGPSPINRSPMNPEMMAAQQGGAMMSSEGNMIPPTMMNNSQAAMTQSNRMATSQNNMMTSQSNMMTSQSNMMTSQSSMMASQPNMISQARTSQPRMTSQSQPMISSPHMTSQPNIMTSQSNMMSSPANMMSQANMLQSQAAMSASQANMMTSSQAANMMASQAAMMSQAGMTPQAGMAHNHHMIDHHGPSGMMTSERVMMSPSARMMTPQGRGPMNSNGPMMSPVMRMTNPMMGHDGMPGHGMPSSGGPMMTNHGRPSSAGMMSPHLGPMSNPEMIMSHQKAQSHMIPSSLGPGHPNAMDGMPGHMDMGNHLPGGMPSRFANPKAGMMDTGGMVEGSMPNVRGAMMPDGAGMEQVMEHPMSRQMMASMRQPQPTSPLSLLQTRFSPPLPPDGKGPTKTLQYFPPGTANSQGGVQGQGGNPHLNPTPNQPSPAPPPGPKQIQMPFPMEMITSGPSTSPSLTQALGPHRMQGMSMGPRMMQGDMMYHHHGEYHGGPRGPSPVAYMGPRQGMPYGAMQHVGHSRMPGIPMGPAMQSDYMEAGFGPQPVPGMTAMGGPMGPGYNMPR